MVSFVCWVNLLYLIFVGLFWFCYGCICIYSVTFSTGVINICLYTGLLQFCGVFLFYIFFLSSSIFSPLFYNFNFFNQLYFPTFIPLFAFPILLFHLKLIFNVYVFFIYLYLTMHSYSFFLFFLSFPLNMFVSFLLIALFPTWQLALVLLSSLCFI